MNLQMVGCHHRHTSIALREQLSFSRAQAAEALVAWRETHPDTEAVLLSTCHRVELYAAADTGAAPPVRGALAKHLAEFHELPVDQVESELVALEDADVVRHLFRVAASLDSMVVGEPQILAQVKQAYELAGQIGSSGPLTNQFFQAALRTARRVASETALHSHRVSIPSVAVADFANQIFERFDDKRVLVLGAGEMADETLRYLVDAGARQIRVANRRRERAQGLAARWQATAVDWDDRFTELVHADLVISTTGAEKPIVSRQLYDQRVVPGRQQRPLFILDLAVPRDFDPDIADALGTYLYSVDDLTAACDENRRARAAELPPAQEIVDEETALFLAELRHRITVPVINQLRQGALDVQQSELERLFRKLPELDTRAQDEIARFSQRLVGKILHPPLESLRDESQRGSPHNLLDALRRLFQLKE